MPLAKHARCKRMRQRKLQPAKEREADRERDIFELLPLDAAFGSGRFHTPMVDRARKPRIGR